ncbi:hypothetical protein ABQE16_16945 [Enterococcus avium]|uniref:hypothetical protein n=1 Tax=Enterococcus avium TaxID=33945 RepID=UPI002065B9D9|nr:MAG TPA: hypothetical protein [Caudoviricetes sp.]
MKQELLKWIYENKVGRPSVFGLGAVETVYMDDLIEMINELEEPQVTNEQAWNKIAESYPETAQNLRITLDHAVYGHETEPQKAVAQLAEKWHEDIGPVLWWDFPVEEPPYCGTPLDDDFPKYKTHFTELHIPDEVEEEPKWVVKVDDNAYFVDFFDSLTPHLVDGLSWEVMRLDDKSKADAVALIIGGKAEKA